MNNHCYRIIFNRARGLLMAVAETVSGQGRSNAASAGSHLRRSKSRGNPVLTASVHPLCFSVWLALGLVMCSSIASAQVVADPHAPGKQRPTVLNSPNGVPLVNIQTPSAAGVSRNTYSQFDVQQQGAILNNSRKDTQTQLGGWVQGNPWLAAGSARVILNEVNSNNPSLLRGYVEVAGQRAQVVIANPAGVTCDGCGFINANRATLTTGTPILNGGSLDGYRVQRGLISVTGAGLDASRTDYTELIARAVQVNAGIWAARLNVTTGANHVNVDSGGERTTVSPMTGSGAAPAFAIDVAQLGGMYAGKITLVGTEAGVGVRNAGDIGASAGEVIVTADGRIENAGQIGAMGYAKIESTQDIRNGGSIAAQGDVSLRATGAHSLITNTDGASVSSVGNLTLQSAVLSNRAGGLYGGQELSVQTGALDNDQGLIHAGASLKIATGSETLTNTRSGETGGLVSEGHIDIQAGRLDNTQGYVGAGGNLMLTSAGGLNNSQGLISAAGTLSARDSTAGKTLDITNTAGTLTAGQLLAIDARRLSGDGTLQSLGDLNIKLTRDYTHSGVLQANGTASLETAGRLTNQSTLGAGDALNITAVDIDNQASGAISATALRLLATQGIANRGLIDGSDTTINARTLDNPGTGRIYGDHVAIAVEELKNIGGSGAAPVIGARERLDIGASTIDNREGALLFSAGSLHIGGALDGARYAVGQANAVNNVGATIQSLGAMNLAAAYMNNGNAHFTITPVVVAGPTTALYIQPKGLSAMLSLSNVYWEGNNAGRYRYNTNPPPNGGSVLGQTPVPRVGAQSCSGTAADRVCSRAPGVDYLSSDPAWAYWGIAPPAVAPSAPTLVAPVAPDLASASTCQAATGYNATACSAYGNALAQYQLDHATYETARSADASARAAWQAQSDARYAQLDARIAAYNNSFAGREILDWTQYNITRTQTKSQVATSAPGQILAGGDLRLTGGDLVNDKSQIIVGGALGGDLANLRTIEAEGEVVIHNAGTSQGTSRVWRGGLRRSYSRDWYRPNPYLPGDQVTTFVLPVAKRLDHITPSSSGPRLGDFTAVALNTSGPGAVNTAITSTTPPESLTNLSSLYRLNTDGGRYLIETDPRFANYRKWLSSDYLLQALSLDSNSVQKRMGDGFYEQQKVREQIAQLTGRRFLDGYASDEAQYQALMNAGVTFANAQQLTPGIALTAAQMAQLSSDIVWLVAQDVTLPDGSLTKVIVPQVYVSVREGDLQPTGALLSANSVALNLSGDLTNAGTIAGRQVVSLSAQNVQNLGGRIQGQSVEIGARSDLNNIGGTISGTDSVLVTAGRDLNVITTTHSQSNAAELSDFIRTNVDRVAGLYVTGENALLVASAGRDVHLIGAAIVNQGSGTPAALPVAAANAQTTQQPTGQTVISAGRDLDLGTVTTVVQDNTVSDIQNHLRQGHSEDVGTVIETQGDARLQAGRDVSARAASVTSQTGALEVIAGNNIALTPGSASENFDEASVHTSKGTLSSKTNSSLDRIETTAALASTFSGDTTTLAAGQDIHVKGSNVVSTKATTLSAEQNINVEAATESRVEQHFNQTRRSGLMDSGGIGFTVGTRVQSTDTNTTGLSAAASTIGSTQGNVTLQAGKQYTQTGSDVIAVQGNVDITAKTVDITEAREKSRTETETKFKQTGVTVAVTSPVISAIQMAEQMKKAAGDTKDDRMKVLAGASTGLAAWTAYDAVKTGQGTRINDKEDQINTGNDANGKTTSRDANAADKVGGVNVSISYGQSKSQSNTVQTSDHGSGSTVSAGGDIAIRATGAGKDSNLTIQGSNVAAGNNVTLEADNAINLLAGKNTDEQHSTNKSSSGSIGVSFGTSGFMVNASVSGGRGHADGDDVAFNNTHVQAGKELAMTSGGDTNLKGAVASANQVTANVGGNLSIESRQDTSHYDSKQQSFGASISVGYGAMSGSVSASSSKSNSDFASVTEQSGIRAGDGGFNVNVKGDTDLKGAVIASNDAAVLADRNSLTTGTLTTSDIRNSATASADSSGFGLSSNALDQGKYGLAKTLAGNMLITGDESGESSGVTHSAVSGGRVAITNSAVQEKLTGESAGQTVAKLDRDVTGAHTAAQRQDVGAMELSADTAQTIKQQFFNQLTVHTDTAYKAAFKTNVHFYKVSCKGAPTDCLNDPKLLQMEEISRDEAKRDGKILAVNGILNTSQRAGEMAYQNTPDDPDSQQKPASLTLMYIPKADTTLGEIFVGALEKVAPTLGYTVADVAYADLVQGRGDEETLLIGHSRGTIVQRNALNIVADQEYENKYLSVAGVGGAVGAQDFIDSAARVTTEAGRKNISFTYLANDPISVIAAGNQGDALAAIKEFLNVFTSSNSAHSCYGTGAAGCSTIANPVPGGPVPINQDPSLVRTIRGDDPLKSKR